MDRNPFLCLAIVVSLALTGLCATTGIVLLSLYRVEIPQALTALASMAVGAISGALAVSPHVSGQVGARGKEREKGGDQ